MIVFVFLDLHKLSVSSCNACTVACQSQGSGGWVAATAPSALNLTETNRYLPFKPSLEVGSLQKPPELPNMYIILVYQNNRLVERHVPGIPLRPSSEILAIKSSVRGPLDLSFTLCCCLVNGFV